MTDKKLFIDRYISLDGKAETWNRWIILGVAYCTLMGYSILSVFNGFFVLIAGFSIYKTPDPSFLLFFIPLGILFGDALYRRDLELNDPKSILELDTPYEETSASG